MKRLPLLLLMLAVIAAACGDTAESGSGEPAEQTTAAPTTTATPPTTAAPTTEAPAAMEIVPGEDPDVDAIVGAYMTAFDSVSDYAAKAPFIDDPSGLEETVGKYLTTGESMGGIGVVVTDVVIDGDQADVTYDLLFNNNPTYPDLPGTAVRAADGWKVPRSVFCSLMSSARVGCPSE